MLSQTPPLGPEGPNLNVLASGKRQPQNIRKTHLRRARFAANNSLSLLAPSRNYSKREKNQMRLPGGFADEVKSQADIVRIVSDYVSLKKRGANYIARCPFHSEKTPSFNVHQAKGIYKCFGCGAGGSVYDFIMQIEGCAFPEAVRIVANKSGI